MALNADDGRKMLQLLSARYNDWRWRKKLEKTLSLPQSGVEDEKQQAIFLFLKQHLKAYKSRRADPDTWIVGGFATKQVFDRIKQTPTDVAPALTADDVAYLGTDPGEDVTEAWWDDMLVAWFDRPEDEVVEGTDEAGGAADGGDEAVAAAATTDGAASKAAGKN
ncbi:MAG: hypothetical protein U0172_04895 [Nitrospiraceae bacterium]